MQVDPGVLITAAVALSGTIVMVVSLRYQIKKDAAARQRAMQKEIRDLVGDMDSRHRETIKGMRQEIRVLHDRIDRKEIDYKRADSELGRDVKEVTRAAATLEGVAAQIQEQVKLIQRIQHERGRP